MIRLRREMVLMQVLVVSLLMFFALPPTSWAGPLSPVLPSDANPPFDANAYYTFAWQEFIALNWPALQGVNGQPDTTKPFGQPGRVVWETWKEAADIFQPGAPVPPSWNEPDLIPPECTSLAQGRDKVIRMVTKVSDEVDERDQAVGGVLIDQNGNTARYEVRMNQTQFEYIVENQFYNGLIQAAAESISFPLGSLEIKASWRELGAGDDLSRYHVAETLIVNSQPPEYFERLGVPPPLAPCEVKQMGLVGLHVVHKIPSAPQSTWATFEQVDNVRVPPGSGLHPSFNDPSCSECVPNCRQAYCPDQLFTQVTRETPIPPEVADLNARMWALFRKELPGSKWQYYQLVGIQHRLEPSQGGTGALDTTFLRLGLTNRSGLLANTTMETFNQTGSSCIGCHFFARATNPAKLSDLSWSMRRAHTPDRPPLPGSDAAEILAYVSEADPYTQWGTWPDDQWNIYSTFLEGENPHGKTVRLYVNDIALDAITTGDARMRRRLPPGSIIVKENYRSTLPAHPVPADLVELTIMYKIAGFNPPANDWFWLKASSTGTQIDDAGKVEPCITCHAWEGNGDFMLLYNFGEMPVIRTSSEDE